MKTSNTIASLSAALLKAQRNIGAAVKGAANPFFKSRYADLGSVMEACKDALNNEGITVLQPVQSDADGDFVETILLHNSGEYISSSMKLVLAKQDMQSYGSAVSYARRYSLQSLVFIPAEDDDGEATMGRQKHAKKVESAPLSKEVVDVMEPINNIQKTLKERDAALLAAETKNSEAPKSFTSFRQSKISTHESFSNNAINQVPAISSQLPSSGWDL